MAEVLVTGGTGVLGRRVVEALARRGHSVRVLSRSAAAAGGGAQPADAGGADGGAGRGGLGVSTATTRVVRGDLNSGEGLDAALACARAVVHCATGSSARTPRGMRAVDVEGTRRLASAALRARVGQLVYPSIVGIDEIPFGYYRAKVAAERVLAHSRLDYTIARSTQFHDLIAAVLGFLRRGPVQLVPRGFRLQPVDAGEVAERLAELVDQGPSGRVSDLGGPEVLSAEALAERYLSHRSQARPSRMVPVPGRSARAVRGGRLLCPGGATGTVDFATFLRQRPA